MEQIREVAMAYYTRSAADEKKLAHECFGALDGDGNGRVSLAEYKTAFGSDFNDYTSKLFDGIDQNGDGTLDFEEFLTLYYMSKVNIRNCDGCKEFLLGSYFSCVQCEKGLPASPYDLCCACYGGGKLHHHHSADNFLDDRSMRLLFMQYLQKADDQPAQPEPELSSPPPVHEYNSRSSKEEKVKTAIEAFNTGFSVGSAMVTIGSAAGCIVM